MRLLLLTIVAAAAICGCGKDEDEELRVNVDQLNEKVDELEERLDHLNEKVDELDEKPDEPAEASPQELAQTFRDSEIKAARAQISALETMLEIYWLDMGVYPTTEQGLAALRVAPNDLPDPSKWQGPYARKDIPPDPWQNAYFYELLGANQYKVYSVGPDGQPGTDDDIVVISQ